MALSKNPNLPPAIAHLVVGLEYTCQWDKLELYHPMLERATDDALSYGRLPDEDPMLNIRRCTDTSVNQAVSRAWSRNIQRRALRAAKCLGGYCTPAANASASGSWPGICSLFNPIKRPKRI